MSMEAYLIMILVAITAISIFVLFISLFGLIKCDVVSKHFNEAMRLIKEPATVKEQLELHSFLTIKEIEEAYGSRNLLNPFRWSFAATFPRLHNEVKRRKEIAEL